MTSNQARASSLDEIWNFIQPSLSEPWEHMQPDLSPQLQAEQEHFFEIQGKPYLYLAYPVEQLDWKLLHTTSKGELVGEKP